MIKWFQAKWTKSIQKFGKVLLKPATAFEEEIIELLQNINKKATQFKVQADISYKDIDLQNTGQTKALMVRMVDENEYRHSMVVRKIDSTSIDMNRNMEHFQDSLAKAISGIYDMLISDPERAQSVFTRRPSPEFQEQEIIDAYGYDPYLLGEDCQRLLEIVQNMDVDTQPRV
ncbi:hypothetical protein GTA08_BOTSDO07468 [Botryosphaeria dothidea]|uniref:Uncharacterized protein n=1 Tax=Botryosphaeria dothidea TaxID=55169 RepID=A0A8H4IQP5_9PEZI|nr:hypothetical protein GTA08_BOTSDO07468 [Botryosphaeria dothidea]